MASEEKEPPTYYAVPLNVSPEMVPKPRTSWMIEHHGGWVDLQDNEYLEAFVSEWLVEDE